MFCNFGKLKPFQGRLRVDDDTTGDDLLPPPLPGTDTTDERVAGDVRAAERPTLAVMHTLFLREHNRIADLISAADQGATDEDVYQRARKAVGAEMQNVVWDEFLPTVLGEEGARRQGLDLPPLSNSNNNQPRTRYEPRVDPSITNAFATAAFR